MAIELQSKRLAEGGESSFGGIGFGSLDGDVMGFTGRGAAALAGAMAFADDGCPVRMHGDADPRDIDRQETAPVFAGQHTAGIQGFPAPAIEAKDSVGFGDHVPAFQIGELPAMGFIFLNVKDIWLASGGDR